MYASFSHPPDTRATRLFEASPCLRSKKRGRNGTQRVLVDEVGTLYILD